MIHVCSFSSGLDELSRRKQRDDVEVLRILHQRGRFSVFEATATSDIARTMTRLMKSEYVKDLGGAYPWTNVKLTDAGLRFIA